ncbi:3-methyl-2-oxobutanoate hydroxymethyltransferase [Candidatus Sumerlaeota bacterium]|nr:3-methyl-2-oxobutanoate hydroxymethyltransferase [Candidatus Sumerlaeota bacterium]
MSAKVRIATLQEMKREGKKIVMVTAYDYPTGRLADEAGVDAVLVGDSLGNTVLGYDDTIPVTLDQMIYHCAAVARGAKRALRVADMPFMTYKGDRNEALRNAGRLIQKGHCEAVKLEGGHEVAGTVHSLVQAGIPVMGHIGLTPQSIHALSGYRVQGRGNQAAEHIVESACELERAGCFAVVVELVPGELGRRVAKALHIPAIGIGAGAQCDGQVLVLTDLLGISFGPPPRFVKEFGQVGRAIREAVETYSREVREGAYPAPEHEFDTE